MEVRSRIPGRSPTTGFLHHGFYPGQLNAAQNAERDRQISARELKLEPYLLLVRTIEVTP